MLPDDPDYEEWRRLFRLPDIGAEIRREEALRARREFQHDLAETVSAFWDALRPVVASTLVAVEYAARAVGFEPPPSGTRRDFGGAS
ncbi:hypothetical protein [Tomitella gaofuii]|uniref:hypothetical protein n=1 Tax=Tomitella gaofuii TaxID=2760083 RepID=UPI0015FC916B|nr:hypothetical protein [Tomitella gaofuii]